MTHVCSSEKSTLRDNLDEESTTMIYHQVLAIRDVSEAECEVADYAGNAELCVLWRKAKTTPVDWL